MLNNHHTNPAHPKNGNARIESCFLFGTRLEIMVEEALERGMREKEKLRGGGSTGSVLFLKEYLVVVIYSVWL